MSSTLRRILDPGPNATIWPGSSGDLRFHGNADILRDTGTEWVRLWADWPRLQPEQGVAIDDPANPGAPYLQVLDEQVALANELGVKVLLVLYRHPPWANGTARAAARRGSDQEISFGFFDRIAQRAWERYLREGRDPARYAPSRRSLEYRAPPQGFGPRTAWAAWFAFLYDRYGRPNAGLRPFADGIELSNEPNWILWPQREPPALGADPWALTPLRAPASAAEMSVTARAIAAARGDSTLLFHGSLADTSGDGRRASPYDEFTAAYLDALDQRGFLSTAQDAYAHHNYTDLERRETVTRVQRVRDLLRGRWTGYAEGEAPTVFVTEGGVRVNRTREHFPQEDPLEGQALSMRLAMQRYGRDDGPGAGVAMLAQYQTYTDPGFDSGLLEPWPSTTRRPVYGAWAAGPAEER